MTYNYDIAGQKNPSRSTSQYIPSRYLTLRHDRLVLTVLTGRGNFYLCFEHNVVTLHKWKILVKSNK